MNNDLSEIKQNLDNYLNDSNKIITPENNSNNITIQMALSDISKSK